MIREGRVLLDAAGVATPMLTSSAVRDGWDEPSALTGMTVGSLAGHLVRAVTTVEAYLSEPTPGGGSVLDAPGYLLSIEGLDGDPDSDLHRAIRSRADAEAAGGHAAVVERWTATIDRLRARLETVRPDRLVAALGRRVLPVGEYLVTRLVEVVAHTDDLAVSLGVEAPSFDGEATGAVVGCLVEVARRRHGDLAVIRAMIRTERDAVRALRVL